MMHGVLWALPFLFVFQPGLDLKCIHNIVVSDTVSVRKGL